MKIFSLSGIGCAIAVAAILMASPSPNLQSQVPQSSPLQALQALKAGNEQLLQRQTATLVEIDKVAEEARQLRIFARRT